MGFSVGWFAVSDSSPDAVAAEMGHSVGDELDNVDGMCIGEIGKWTLIYNDQGEPLLDDAELQKLSVEHSIVVHESVDSVMYARTAQWGSGELSWSAVVYQGTLDKENHVVTKGLAKSVDQRLRRSYRREPADAYDDVAEMARRIVGFRHDRSGNTGFRQLIDNRPKPASTPDRAIRWLISQGFEARDPNADGKNDRLFKRQVDGPYWIIVEVKQDRYQLAKDWCAINVSIRHDALAPVNNNQIFFENDFASTARLFVVHGHRGNAKQQTTEELPFNAVTASIQDSIDDATRYCTDERLLRICDPATALVVEVTLGWSNRGESALEEAKAQDVLGEHPNSRHQPRSLEWLEKYRDSPRIVEPEPVEQSVAELQARLDSDEYLNGRELAVLQARLGGSGKLVEALGFEHWLRFFTLGDLDPLIAAHAARHNLFHGEVEAIARAADLPSEVELVFAEHSDVNVPNYLATNPDLKPATQMRLAAIRADGPWGLAGNPALIPELRAAFAASADDDVREAVAGNPGTSEELLTKLLKDRKSAVKRAAARNPSLPASLQVAVFETGTKNTKGGLRMNEGLCERVQRGIVDLGEIETIASNPALLPDLMEVLAGSDDTALRKKLASNPALHRSLQEQLAEDTDADVRRVLARNTAIDPEIRAQAAS